MIDDQFLIAAMLQDELEDLGCEVIGPIADFASALDACRTTDAGAAVVNMVLNGERALPLLEILASRNIPFGFAGGANHAPDAWRARPSLSEPYASREIGAFLLLILPKHRPPTGQQD